MFNRTNALILVIAIAGAAGGFLAGGWLKPLPSSPHANRNALRVGDAMPEKQRPDPEGKAHSLGEWRGRLVLMNFWASWCGPCREEMPLLDKTQQRLAAQGVQIVGVAFDGAAATREFLKQTPVQYPILIDDPGSETEDLSALFGNERGVLPYTVLIGRDGRIIARRAGNFTETTLDAWLSPHL